MTATDPRAKAIRRDRLWDPARRWKALNEFLDWADAQRPVSRNAPAERLRAEALFPRQWAPRVRAGARLGEGGGGPAQ